MPNFPLLDSWVIMSEQEYDLNEGTNFKEDGIYSSRVCQFAIGKPFIFDRIAKLDCHPDSPEANLMAAAPDLFNALSEYLVKTDFHNPILQARQERTRIALDKAKQYKNKN